MRRTSITLLLGLILLQGCAGRALVLREDTGTLVEVTKQTVTQVRKFYAEQGARRLNYYLDIASQDSHCRADPIILVLPDNAGAVPFKCLTDELRKKCQADNANVTGVCKNIREIELLPRSDIYQYALTFVDVIADYQALLAKIASQENSDAGGELAVFVTRLTGLQQDLQKVVPDLKTLAKKIASDDVSSRVAAVEKLASDEVVRDQLAAVGKLLDLIRQAAAAEHAVGKLKEAMRMHGSEFEESLDMLAQRYQQVDLAGRRLLERDALEAKRRAYSDLVAQGKTAKMSSAERRAKLAELLDAERLRREQLAQPDPLASALTALRISEQRLRSALLDDRLTQEQRHRIAQENVKGLKAVFGAISSAVLAFR